MVKYCIKRFLYIILVFFILSFLLFMIYNLIPISKAYESTKAELTAFQSGGGGSAFNWDERFSYYEVKYGEDVSKIFRYLRWMGLYPFTNPDTGKTYYNGLFQGYLGTSNVYNSPVLEVIKAPMKNTIFINIFAIAFGLGITIPLGIFCAVKKGSKADVGVQVGTIIGYSLPTFIIAIVFMWLFSLVLKIFPVSGSHATAGYLQMTSFEQFINRLYYMCLPLIVMTFCSLGGMTRYVRSSMIEALSLDCIRTARAKGLKEKIVIYSHAWRNALIPIVTLVIGWFLGIFSGSMMIEHIFQLNGIGEFYYNSLRVSDNEVVLGLQMFYITVGLIGNLIIDIAYGIIDPRIRVNG